MRTAPFGRAVGGAGIPGAPPRPPSLTGMVDCKSQLDSQAMAYITSIDNRRLEIADELTGLALEFSHFRHDMKTKEYKILNDPSLEIGAAEISHKHTRAGDGEIG